jgi:hypothetical protein
MWDQHGCSLWDRLPRPRCLVLRLTNRSAGSTAAAILWRDSWTPDYLALTVGGLNRQHVPPVNMLNIQLMGRPIGVLDQRHHLRPIGRVSFPSWCSVIADGRQARQSTLQARNRVFVLSVTDPQESKRPRSWRVEDNGRSRQPDTLHDEPQSKGRDAPQSLSTSRVLSLGGAANRSAPE